MLGDRAAFLHRLDLLQQVIGFDIPVVYACFANEEDARAGVQCLFDVSGAHVRAMGMRYVPRTSA